MRAPLCTPGMALGWTMLLFGMASYAPTEAKTSVVTLSQLVSESDTIVYGSFKLGPKRSAQSTSFQEFAPISILLGKNLSARESITFCNASGESSPDLSRMRGTLVIFAKKQLECFQLAHGNKSIVRVRAGRARTAVMDDQPEAQPLASLLKKIRALVARQPGT